MSAITDAPSRYAVSASYVYWSDGTSIHAEAAAPGLKSFTMKDLGAAVNQGLSYANGGGHFIKKGVYIVNNTIVLAPSNNGAMIMGEGGYNHYGPFQSPAYSTPQFSTILQPGKNIDMIKIAPDGTLTTAGSVAGITISNLNFIDPLHKQTSTGTILLDTLNGIVVDSRFEHIQVNDCQWRGIYCSTTTDQITTSTFIDNSYIDNVYIQMNVPAGSLANAIGIQLFGGVGVWMSRCRVDLSFQAGAGQIGYDIECGTLIPAIPQGMFISNCEVNTNQLSTHIGWKFNAVNSIWMVNCQSDVGGDGFQFGNNCENMILCNCTAANVNAFHFLASANSTSTNIFTGCTTVNTATTGWKSDAGDTMIKLIIAPNNMAGTAYSPNPLTAATIYASGSGSWNPYVGKDNRSGLTAADGAATTLYAVPAGTLQLYRVTADIFATAFTSGTATYTITWTENAVTRTLVVTATALNTLGTITGLINPDASTNITVQLTGVFTATVKVACIVERIA